MFLNLFKGVFELLTSKQHELLLFINERLQKDGVSPSFDEMKDALNPVSYTHLDVYKRQDCASAALI